MTGRQARQSSKPDSQETVRQVSRQALKPAAMRRRASYMVSHMAAFRAGALRAGDLCARPRASASGSRGGALRCALALAPSLAAPAPGPSLSAPPPHVSQLHVSRPGASCLNTPDSNVPYSSAPRLDRSCLNAPRLDGSCLNAFWLDESRPNGPGPDTPRLAALHAIPPV